MPMQASLPAESSSQELLLLCRCCPQRQEPWEAVKVSCGANVSPLIMFQSLGCWPQAFGNQPSQAQRERAAAHNCRISPWNAFSATWTTHTALEYISRTATFNHIARSCLLFNRHVLCYSWNEMIARAQADPGEASAVPTSTHLQLKQKWLLWQSREGTSS